ncbi:MAG: glutathione S-transferase [Proteobacteria bacterium]|nr:glutathione S-transferase [Pseudomonadota bacterium]HQR03794.1 glutathione S-transferase [Rhodocyclaceae bacterium]
MKLIGSLTSPYVRKTRVVLAEKKIEYDFVITPPGAAGSVVAGYNPLARIPVLVLDDDTALFDSPVIVEYLDSAAPNNKLLPQPNRERIEAKRWEALADGLLDAAVDIRRETQRPGKEQSLAWIERNRQVIETGLIHLDQEIGEKNWCMGTHFNLSDVAVGCVLGYLDLRFPALDWRARHANLLRLSDKLMQRPSFQDTAPPAGA